MAGRSRISIDDQKYGDDERRVIMRARQPGGTLLVSLRVNERGVLALDVTNDWGERVEIWSGRAVCEDGGRVAVTAHDALAPPARCQVCGLPHCECSGAAD